MAQRPTIIFDTSAINRLANDLEFGVLFAGIKSAFFVRITETSISEIVANGDAAKRTRLLAVLRTLLTDGECVQPFQLVIQEINRRFEVNPTGFNWRHISVRFPQAEYEIARQAITSDELATVQREQLRTLDKDFERMFAEMRPSFDALFQKGVERPSFPEVVEIFTRAGGAMWAYGEIVYGKTAVDASEERIRQLYKVCPPFRALLLALCAAQYERCIRDIRKGESLRAGRVDMFVSTFLPYCDTFVTDDKKQLQSLRAVAAEGGLEVSIRSYREFRKTLIGLS